MVVSGGRRVGRAAPAERVIWHDAECGGYRADLPLWLELAAKHCVPAGELPLLDVGAGTGRVAVALARAGQRVDAVDRDGELLAALAERAANLPVRTFCADARELSLERHDYPLCIVPMQTIQLLATPADRLRFLELARAHLREDGVLACAIVATVEDFDRAAGDTPPPPERVRRGGRSYESTPVRVQSTPEGIAIERERTVRAPDGRVESSSIDLIELASLSVRELEQEGERAGFRAEPARSVGETAEHVGSVVVMLRA